MRPSVDRSDHGQDAHATRAGHRNQNAHEVSRDLTAWAYSSIEPILTASMLPSLGPPRPAQRRKSGDCLSARTVDADLIGIAHPTGWLGGFPTGRLWDFALPDPFSSSAALPHPLPGESCHLGPTHRLSEDSLLAGRCITRGDVNPTCHGLLEPISFGWPGNKGHPPLIACALRRRRWPPTPAVPAIPCFARLTDPLGVGLRIRSLFHFRRPISRPTTGETIRASPKKRMQNRQGQPKLSTTCRK
jgi:hypothetical protein